MGIRLIILLSHLLFPTVKNRFLFYCIILAEEWNFSSASAEMHVSENGCLITVNPPPPPRPPPAPNHHGKCHTVTSQSQLIKAVTSRADDDAMILKQIFV
jgi:hypothetical protein